MKKTAHVEIRSQKSQGGSGNGFGGPDTYVTVQVVPEGVNRLICLNQAAAKRRGIKLIHCGEGYHDRQTSGRSMLSLAIAEAEEIANKINNN